MCVCVCVCGGGFLADWVQHQVQLCVCVCVCVRTGMARVWTKKTEGGKGDINRKEAADLQLGLQDQVDPPPAFPGTKEEISHFALYIQISNI